MTKDERVERAQCPKSPTGRHTLVTPEEPSSQYYGVCKWCGCQCEICGAYLSDVIGARAHINDYGVESGTDAQAANMEDILVTRYENLLPTMMTTNMDWSQLPERIASRFDDRQLSRRVHNEAPDYRGQK